MINGKNCDGWLAVQILFIIFRAEILLDIGFIASAGRQTGTIGQQKLILIIALITHLPDVIGVEQQGTVNTKEGILVQLLFAGLERLPDQKIFVFGKDPDIVSLRFQVIDVVDADR